MDLRNAQVIGYFSLPSASLAERNTDAYNNAMAAAPAGAGACGHCGTGILHHVIIKLSNGNTAFIGTTCAEKVGTEQIKNCVRAKLTSEQLAEKQRKIDAQVAVRIAEEKKLSEYKAARLIAFKDILDALEAKGTDFHSSLAEQLRFGTLSSRQAEFVAKAVMGRYTKKNADQWEMIYERCQA